MPQRVLELHDGVLSSKVESWQSVELSQLNAEVEANQIAYDKAVEDLVNTAVNPDELVAAATRRDEAKAALADSKSDLARGRELVPESPALNEDGSTPVDVQVASPDAQF